jgi:outer membrane protein insertion porin family
MGSTEAPWNGTYNGDSCPLKQNGYRRRFRGCRSSPGAVFLLFLFSVAGWTQESPNISGADSIEETAAQSSYVISSVKIEIQDDYGQEARYREMAAAVAGITTGDTVTDKTIAQALESLKNCGRFENVFVEVEPAPEGAVLHIRLKPFYYVKDLKLAGIWPLFVKEVGNVMTMHTGSPFSPRLMKEQELLIRELYRREGISLNKVTVSVVRDEKDGNYIVAIHLKPGRWFRIASIDIQGSRNMSVLGWRYTLGGIRELLPLSGERFVRKNHDKALKATLKNYRDKRFYDAQVHDTVMVDSSAYQVMLKVRIEEGRRYKIAFEGNSSFSNRILRKRCDFESGNRNNRGIKDCRDQLIDFYRQKGFESIKIEYGLKEKEEEKLVTFKIGEGRRTKIQSLLFSGNKEIEKKDIIDQVLLKEGKPFSSRILSDDVEGIYALYLQKGFVGTKVDTVITRSETKKKDIQATVEFHIEEGLRQMVTSVELESGGGLLTEKLMDKMSLKSGDPYVKSRVNRDREVLSALVAENGYPYCLVDTKLDFNQDSSGIRVMYTIDPGEKAIMGRVYTVGNFKTAQSVIDREILMKRGDPFSLRKTLESQRNVQNLPLFGSVQMKPMGLLEKRDTIHFFLELEEQKPLYLKLRSGYESDIGIFGETKIGDRNLLGLNKHGWLAGRVYNHSGQIWKIRDAGWKTEAGLLEPRLWGSRITASTVVSNERIKEEGLEFFADVTTASVGLMRSFWRLVSLGTAFEYELRKASGVRPDSGFTSDDLREQFEYRNNLITRPTLRFDNRDSFIRPRRGFYSGYTIEISRGLDNSIDDFIRYEWIMKGFVSPFPALTLGATGRWQRINDVTLSEDQRLFLGGTQDVRGYPENRLAPGGGNMAVSGSLEARIEIAWGFELALFTDGGNVSTASDPFDPSAYAPGGFKTTAGTGIRYITPVGPVGLLYGHQLNPVHYGAWHFSLGYTF